MSKDRAQLLLGLRADIIAGRVAESKVCYVMNILLYALATLELQGNDIILPISNSIIDNFGYAGLLEEPGASSGGRQ